MVENDIQETIDFARQVIENPDLLGRDIYEATVSETVEEIEAHLIEFRKLDNDRYCIDGWELYLAIAMSLDGSSDADIRKRITIIREKYPITAQYPDEATRKHTSITPAPKRKSVRAKTAKPRPHNKARAQPPEKPAAAPIFISYSHKDSRYAHALTEALKRSGLSVWKDDEIDYGAQWSRVIEEHLDGCSAFIIILTPDSRRSAWVQNELNRAQRKEKPIFPLLLKGDEPWLQIESIQFVDVRDGNLPPKRFFDLMAKIAGR